MQETRKTVLFIVEGVSDKEALEKIIKKIYRNTKIIEFEFTEGDISSDLDITLKNVEKRIIEVVNGFLKDKKLKKTDIYQIIQLFDMDGAYISDDVIFDGESNKILYSAKGIYCKNPEKVKARNSHKREIMNHLLSLNSINGISYEMYFMSCNLDHALYDEQNLAENLKCEYADAFYEKFIGKEIKFIDFLREDVVDKKMPNTLSGSWRYIKEDLHSLERNTNLGVYFELHPVI